MKMRLVTARDLYNKFPPHMQSLSYGKAVKRFIDLNKNIEIGSQFAEIKQPTPQGKKVKLSSFRGKYILLEFWASWCAPCRKENPNLITVYNEYKSRGFEIYGVSLDRNEHAWKKAIADDQLPWLQVSDLKGALGDPALTYGAYAIPSNFLIDPSGKVIARDLRGKAINRKLKELLGHN